MRARDLIDKKKRGQELSAEEINWLISSYVDNQIPDYQFSAFLMAVYFQGMSKDELYALTVAMAESGHQVDLSVIPGIKVDKHSTGGVGDKISLILAPLVASCGVPVAKMSGRSLGHTGGTIDKLEAIPGFQVNLSQERFVEQVNDIGLALMSQTLDLAPADQKIYTLRDVTATVDSLPLIASSIMSKKLASGADAMVLDVKVGSGAFMKTVDQAEALAQTMVDIGKDAGRQTMALVTDMSQPLGYEVGNTNEVIEAIETLKGHGPKDLNELVLALGARMVFLGGKAETLEDAYQLLKENISNGQALETFKLWVKAQGGDSQVVDDYSRFAQAPYQLDLKINQSGYVSELDAQTVGQVVSYLGAGRQNKDSQLDLTAGLSLKVKIGDFLEADQVWVQIFCQKEELLEGAAEELLQAIKLSDVKVGSKSLIYQEIN